MADKERKDRLWLLLCTSTSVVMDVTLNRYSAVLPGWAVLCLWILPLLFLIVWVLGVESNKLWLKQNFMEHPVSYVLMFLVLIPFGWGATAIMVKRFMPIKELPKTLSPMTPIAPSARVPIVSPVPIGSSESQILASKQKFAATKAPNAAPATVPTGIAKCQDNKGNCAGVNQGTQNTYGEQRPVPKVEWRQTPIKAGVDLNKGHGTPEEEMIARPGVDIILKVMDDFERPRFVIYCSSPCAAIDALTNGVMPSPLKLYFPDDPTHPEVIFQYLAEMPAGSIAEIIVRSMDDREITVSKVEGYAEPINATGKTR